MTKKDSPGVIKIIQKIRDWSKSIGGRGGGGWAGAERGLVISF